MSNLQNNTASLEALIEIANALPSAVGGLPPGISAIASGEITAAENVNNLEVVHNLGVVPNFISWAITDDTSGVLYTSTATFGATVLKPSKYNSSTETVYDVFNLIGGYNASSTQAQTASRSTNAGYMTETIATMRGNTTYPFQPGNTYRWVCGVMDGIL